ncbi:hypothetical protein CDL15_Pgr019342 [Punica granatum]|uniref:Uncharacterized protein n=1 Tax=Punica granatum TaxID=22663 RepID=A0A218X5W2_PUNGR|nr:hypothetical protein CDL15_Pgr019342 [Punica granatum]PKI71816.1 hypothetical protein CRG98_007832 [Punica granatum]
MAVMYCIKVICKMKQNPKIPSCDAKDPPSVHLQIISSVAEEETKKQDRTGLGMEMEIAARRIIRAEQNRKRLTEGEPLPPANRDFRREGWEAPALLL